MQLLAASEPFPPAEACLDYLDRELAHLSEVRDSLHEQNHAIRRADLSLLELVKVRQQVLVDRTEELTRRRAELVADLAKATNLPAEEVHLSRLESLLPAGYSYRIHEKRLAILVLASEIQKLSQRNARLARYCRSYVTRLISATSPEITPAVRYGPRGSFVEGHTPLYLCQG